MLDACAPAMIIAYGVGRLGCHFQGDGDWGDPNPITKTIFVFTRLDVVLQLPQ